MFTRASLYRHINPSDSNEGQAGAMPLPVDQHQDQVHELISKMLCVLPPVSKPKDVLKIPIGVSYDFAVGHRTAKTVATSEMIKPLSQRRIRVAAIEVAGACVFRREFGSRLTPVAPLVVPESRWGPPGSRAPANSHPVPELSDREHAVPASCRTHFWQRKAEGAVLSCTERSWVALADDVRFEGR